jgi:epoxyqueuosine reductase
MTPAEAIKREARAVGFDAVGISRVDLPSSHEPIPLAPLAETLFTRLQQWLAQGYHASMAWMARTPERRADPTLVLPGCRSIISVGLSYYTGHRADESPGYGRIARYAWGQDYHKVLLDKLSRLEAHIQALAQEAHTRCYVDTGPVMEKAWAQRAGLGWIGKHSNLVSAEHGSWLVLGEILTTLELAPDEPATDLCGTCTLCLQACPTRAMPEPYVVDANRCISYLTIELRKPGEEIPPDLASHMSNHIFGCDDCLDICPYNAYATPTKEPAFQPSPTTLSPHLPALAQQSEKAFAEAFRDSPIRRAKYAGFLRNVRIALQNQKQG